MIFAHTVQKAKKGINFQKWRQIWNILVKKIQRSGKITFLMALAKNKLVSIITDFSEMLFLLALLAKIISFPRNQQ